MESHACLADIKGDEIEQEAADKAKAARADGDPAGRSSAVNGSWSFDLVSDSLYAGTRFPVLKISTNAFARLSKLLLLRR